MLVGLLTALTSITPAANAEESNLPYAFDGYVNKLLPPSVARGTLTWDQVSETILNILPDGTVSQFSKEGQFMRSWGESTQGLTANPTYSAAMLPNGNIVISDISGVYEMDVFGQKNWIYQLSRYWSDWRILSDNIISTNLQGEVTIRNINTDRTSQATSYGEGPSTSNHTWSYGVYSGIQHYYAVSVDGQGFNIYRSHISRDGKFKVHLTGGPAVIEYRNTYGSYIRSEITPWLGYQTSVISVDTSGDIPGIWTFAGSTSTKYSLTTAKVLDTYQIPTLPAEYENFRPLGRPDFGYVKNRETTQLFLADFANNTFTQIGSTPDFKAGELFAESINFQNAAIGPNDEIAVVDGNRRINLYSKDGSLISTFTLDNNFSGSKRYKVDFLPSGNLVVRNQDNWKTRALTQFGDFVTELETGGGAEYKMLSGKLEGTVFAIGEYSTVGKNAQRDFLTTSKGCSSICTIAVRDSATPVGWWDSGQYLDSFQLNMMGYSTLWGISQSSNLDTAVLVSSSQGAQVKVFGAAGELKGKIFRQNSNGQTALDINGDYYGAGSVIFFDSTGNLYVKTILGIAKFKHLQEFTNQPTPSITGTAVVGNDLQAVPGAWDAGTTLSYQWLAGGQPIAGATDSTLRLDSSLVDKMIRVKVIASAPGYVTTSVISEQAPIVDLARQTLKPKPQIIGEFEVGKTLVADAGTWESGVNLWYYWYLNGSYIASSQAPTYGLTQRDVGQKISVTVYGSKPGYYTESASSDPVDFVAKTFDSTSKPVVNGATAIGHYLTVDKGSWPAGTYFNYQWKMDGNDIYGQNGESYLVRESDLNHRVTLKLTATKVGYETIVLESDPIQITWGIFTGSNSPVISGSPKVGSLLQVSQGAVDPYAQVTYQWLRDGNYIWGETGSTYTPRYWEYGNSISVITAWSSEGYQTSTATSPSVRIGLGDISQSGQPQITGNATIGSTLYVSPGSWTNANLSYRWYRDGVLLPSATNSSLTLTKADFGRSFKVQVTGSASNYKDLTLESDSVQVGINKSSAYVDLSGLDLSNLNLSDFDFYYANLSGTKFNGSNLANVRLYGANVSGANFQGTSMLGVTSGNTSGTPSQVPTGWRFSNGYFIGSGANLAGAYLYSLSLDHLDLTGTNFASANLNYANLSFSNLSGANLTSASLSGAVMGGVRSGRILGVPNGLPGGWSIYSGYLIGPGTDLSGVNMSGQSLVGLNLRSANLSGIDLSGTDLTSADLTAANLTGANLTGAKLISTVLLATDLSSANLTNTKLNFANLQTATLLAANLTGANLSLANLTGSQLDGVTGENIVGPAQSYPDGWQITAGKLVKSQVNKGSASIMATAQVGQVLSPNTSNWDEGVVLEYKWLSDGIAINGATARNYTISVDDAGHAISVTVTGIKPGYSSQSVTSGAVTVASDGLVPAQSGTTPVIVGTPTVGSALVASMAVSSNTTAIYQWYRDGKKMTAGNNRSYVLSAADLGKRVSVAVSLIKSGVSLSTNFSATVLVGTGTMPTPKLSVSGQYTYNQRLTATIEDLNGAKVSYQWLRDGIEIPSSAKPVFSLKAEDIGHYISFKATLTKTGYYSLVTKSEGKLVSAADLSLQGKPSIAGTFQIGKMLTVSNGSWDSGAKFSYTWFRNGAVVSTAKSYRISQADSGSRISVEVLATKLGYNSVTVSSNSVTIK